MKHKIERMRLVLYDRVDKLFKDLKYVYWTSVDDKEETALDETDTFKEENGCCSRDEFSLLFGLSDPDKLATVEQFIQDYTGTPHLLILDESLGDYLLHPHDGIRVSEEHMELILSKLNERLKKRFGVVYVNKVKV